MCWQCNDIDKEIQHYRSLADRVTDAGTLQTIDILIANLQERKKAFHAEDSTTDASSAERDIG